MGKIYGGEAEIVVFFFLFFILLLVYGLKSDCNAEESGGVANRDSSDNFFIFFIVSGFGQTDSNLAIIDSIQHKYIKSKELDSLSLAEANFKIGELYRYSLMSDSAYYYYSNAVKIYDKLKDLNRQQEVLLSMADIQETEKDYIGSEENAVKAIKILNKLPKDESNLYSLWNAYNLLGIIALKYFDNKIEPLTKTLDKKFGSKRSFVSL